VGKKLMIESFGLADEWESMVREHTDLMATQRYHKHRRDRLPLKIEVYHYSELSRQLRAFLSRHERRLSRAGAGRITGGMQSLEDGIGDLKLPDLETSDGKVYNNLSKLFASRGSRFNRSSGSGGGRDGPKGEHDERRWLEEWWLLKRYKGILNSRRRMI